MHNRVVLLSTVLASAPSSKSRGASEQLEGGKWKCIDGAVQRRTCLDMLMQKKEDSKMQRRERARQGRRNLSLGHATLWNAQPKVIAALHYDKL